MGVPIRRTLGPLALADDDGICASQTPLAAGSLLINGALAVSGVGVLDTARRVILTFAADETGHSFVVTGLSNTGLTRRETIAGTTAGIVQSVNDYKSVSSVTISAAATGAMKVGTNGVASCDPINLNDFGLGPVFLQVDVSGTVNYTVRTTGDDILALGSSPNSANWVSDTNLASKTSTLQDTLTAKPAWIQIVLNSQTNPGYVVLTVIQAGLAGS